MILENQMSLLIFDTQLGAQGMEDICEIWHCLVSFLLQCGPFGIQVVGVGKCLTDSVCLSLMESTTVKMEGSECASMDKQEQRRLRRN